MLSAQRYVSHVCHENWALHDSTMYHEYGEIFFDCFKMDTANTGIWTDPNHFHNWNDTIASGDTIYKMQFNYLFHFPGALEDQRIYSPVEDSAGNLIPDTTRFYYSGPLIDEYDMQRIASKTLHKKLSDCTVRPCPTSRDFPSNAQVDTIQGHSYFLLLYEKRKDTWRGTKVKIRKTVVDGTTGKPVGTVVKYRYWRHPGKF